jgi:hypothetical protein
MNIDWQRVALNISREMPLVQASSKLGRHKMFLGSLARGQVKEPKFGDGVRLLDLHLDLCGPERHRKLLGD